MRPNIRLTNRAGARLGGLFLLVVVGLGIGLSGPALTDDRPAERPRIYVVEGGDTLWDIAHRYAPNEDPRRFVHELSVLNGLAGSTVFPGQKLIIPQP